MCLFPHSSDLHFASHLSIRYIHDGSETVEDGIKFTATDGTNSVGFVLHVKASNVELLSWTCFEVRKKKSRLNHELFYQREIRVLSR